MVLFGVYQGSSTAVSLLTAWLVSQATSALIVFPLILMLTLQVQLTFIPAWTPYVRH